MGLDLLDFSLHIETSFGVKIGQSDYPKLVRSSTTDLTAGELHAWVVRLCNDRGIPVPPSSWNRVKLALARVTNKSPRIIHPNTWIMKELGFS